MKIPHADQAIVDIRKLRDYCLSPLHIRGQHKARVFEAVLGLTADDAEILQEALLAAVQSQDATSTEQDEYGQRYVIDFMMRTDVGQATIRSSWIVRAEEDFPRLTSCYVL